MEPIYCSETSVKNYHYPLRSTLRMGPIRCPETSVRNYQYSRSTLRMGPIYCPETSVRNYHYWLRSTLRMGPICCPETSVRNYHYSLRSTLRMGPICCPETSVRNCHYPLSNNPEERSNQLFRGETRNHAIWKRGSDVSTGFPQLPGNRLGTAVAQWLRYCATNQKVASSIPDCVIGIFHWHKSFWSHYGPGVGSVSDRNEYQEYFPGGKCGRCVRLITLPPSCAVVKKSEKP
jgi:hypothetical protein